jgi:acyl transferase domain-containing protein
MESAFGNAPKGAQSSESSSCNGCSSESSVMPVAIIGMSCRFPGTATSPDRFWSMLSKGMSGWSQGAGSRFKMDAFYHPATEMHGSVSRTIEEGI